MEARINRYVGARFLKIGDVCYISGDDRAWTILGSCVSVCLIAFDGTVALCHAQLPECLSNVTGDATEYGSKYVDVVVPDMVAGLESRGIKPGCIRAVIIGGSSNFKVALKNYNAGERNVEMARKMLSKLSIQVVAEDVNGFGSRKLLVDTEMRTIQVNEVVMYSW